jgi:cytochrome c peroxidase
VNHKMRMMSYVVAAAAVVLTGIGVTAKAGSRITRVFHTNPSGVAESYFDAGALDKSNVFFQSLGTNGRSCGSCHQEDQGWTITPGGTQARFDRSGGTDPIFRPVDGAVCPTADVSTVDARRAAYKMLLTRGLIRVSMAIPANAEFQLVSVDDPYGCANASDIAMFRRPAPATNLRFLSTVMWDGRESPKGRSLHDNLMSQAMDATLGHAQAAVVPTQDQLESIVAFEGSIYTAQVADRRAGSLTENGVHGGPVVLSGQDFFLGINDPLGQNPTGAQFDSTVFRLYDKWASDGKWSPARQSIARGEQIFNTRPIAIEGVAGLNDALGTPVIMGTCTTCHDSPNVGDHSVAAPLNIGIAAESRRTADMPLYTFRCIATGELYKVTDPGRAMISGKCADIGKFKGPVLRGLAARAPYFHNGSAATLGEAVDFYETRFNLGLTEQEKQDLVAFLQTL